MIDSETLTTDRSTDTTEPMRARPRDPARISLIAGGVLFAVGNLLHPLQHDDHAYEAATWKAAHLTILVSLPLIALGLSFVRRQLSGRIGSTLADVAVAATVIGLFGIAPGSILETFVAPEIGHHAMEELESGALGAVEALFGLAYLGGTVLLGWAIHRAGLRPRWAGPGLIAGAVVMVAVMSSTGPVGGAVIIAATAVYGLALAAIGLRTRPIVTGEG